ncbi:MAG: Cell division protein FtsH [uncultured Sulfurovum sp.]|uniref:Cell division protein FtsH n=1 Tax=uncultured Sulfurovum sp. TaxID=269237 RepID=A0A6S6SFC7_9BACT|nr:MAG: Cell division protein FtsH [uncultured Sulfurovum sp.]
MSDWLKKLIEKIKNSELYKKIEKKLQESAPATQNIPTKQKVMMGIMFLLIIDMSIFIFSSLVNINKEETELQKISKNLEEVKYFESNNSALGDLLASDKVYFIVDEELKVDVIFQEGNLSKEIKNLPIYSITRSIEKELIKANINYQWIEKESVASGFVILTFISDHALDLIFIGLILFLLKSSGMMMLGGGDKFKVYKPKEIKGSMDDIIGYEDIKEEIQHLVDMLKNIALYSKYGIEDIFNIMFSGVQGTGKTTMAVQIAKKLEVPILVTTGNIETGFVGGGANIVKKIYARANELASENKFQTCIVFIDEAQNLLVKRGQSREKWADDTPNELLTHLEGVKTINDVRIITIVASNFDESNMQLDEAMAARFKKKIHFRLPNEEEREALLKHFMKPVENKEESIEIKKLAKAFSGTSPRTLQTIVQEASLLAIVKQEKVNHAHLMKAFEVVMIGQSNRKTTKNKEKERHIISIHEIGHFLMNFKQTLVENDNDMEKTEEQMKVIKISSENISRVNALGYVLSESDDMLLHSIFELEKEVRILYGGVAAEELISGKQNITTGSANDIEKITHILKHLFIETSAYSNSKLKLDGIEMLQKEAYLKMEAKAAELYTESLELLKDEQALIEHLAGLLIERWVLSKEEIFEEIRKYKEQN